MILLFSYTSLFLVEELSLFESATPAVENALSYKSLQVIGLDPMVSIIEIIFVLSPLSILLVVREGVTEVSVIDIAEPVLLIECHLLSSDYSVAGRCQGFHLVLCELGSFSLALRWLFRL